MTLLRLEMALALAVLTCGPVLLWRRRDNILGYLAGGMFLSSILLPLLGTPVLDRFDPRIVEQAAAVLLVGAAGYLGGLACGARIGGRAPDKVPLTFTRRLAEREVPPLVLTRTRVLGGASVVALVAGFLLLGYVPFLAPDRQAAKYGVGVYQGAFERGAALYRLALALSGATFPVVLVIVARRRRAFDVGLAVAIGGGLLLSLSRSTAFSGPLLFGIAWAVQRRIRPALIVGAVCLAFSAGALVNEILYPVPGQPGSLATRVAASAPDVGDQLGFLRGFEATGSQRTGVRTLVSGISFSKGEWDPSTYAIRTLTGLTDVSGLASGGIRLPAPVWGYAAFGLVGALLWPFISGVFAGWGVTKLKRWLADVGDGPGSSLNLVLAATFYTGTFGVLANFYFPASVGIVLLGVAVALGVAVRVRLSGPQSAVPERVAGTMPHLG